MEEKGFDEAIPKVPEPVLRPKRATRTMEKRSMQEKIMAIKRVRLGESKASVARDIGVPESTLRGWCKSEQKLFNSPVASSYNESSLPSPYSMAHYFGSSEPEREQQHRHRQQEHEDESLDPSVQIKNLLNSFCESSPSTSDANTSASDGDAVQEASAPSVPVASIDGSLSFEQQVEMMEQARRHLEATIKYNAFMENVNFYLTSGNPQQREIALEARRHFEASMRVNDHVNQLARSNNFAARGLLGAPEPLPPVGNYVGNVDAEFAGLRETGEVTYNAALWHSHILLDLLTKCNLPTVSSQQIIEFQNIHDDLQKPLNLSMNRCAPASGRCTPGNASTSTSTVSSYEADS